MLRVQKDKGFSFDGKVSSGTVVYVGKDYVFDYTSYSIAMGQIDSMRFEVNADTSAMDSDEPVKREEVVNGGFRESSGTLYISPPNNRSFKIPAPKYPRFGSKTDADVYFNDPRILGGAYGRDVYFEAPPFQDR